MPNGPVEMDERTFKGMNEKDRSWVVMLTLQKHIKITTNQNEINQERFTAIEHKQKVDFKKFITVSGITGLIGGMIVHAKNLLFKN